MSGAAEPPRMSLRERNRKQTREAILRSAQLLMMRDGAAGTSMVEVAALSGVSDTTVFNYFKTKTDLLDAVVEELDNPTQFLTLLSSRPAGEGPFTALRHLMREAAESDKAFDAPQTLRYIAAVRADPALWGSYLRVSHQTGEALAGAFAEHAPGWSPLHAKTAAHATVAALTAVIFEISERWTVADLHTQVDDLFARLERAWPV